MLHRDPAGDHLHEVAFQDGGFERVGHPDWEEISRRVDGEEPADTTVTMSDVGACFALILQWALGADTLTLAGARIASLGVYLDPVHNARFGSNLAEIAREAGCTRAALSKALMDFRDDCGIQLSGGKRSEARASYRQTQIEALEAGRHSSQRIVKKQAT